MKDETEKELLTYLHEQRVVDISGSLRTIVNQMQLHEHKDDLRHEEVKGICRGLSLRVGEVEKDTEKVDERLEKSGNWQIEAEQARAIAASNAATWWKEKAITIIVGLVMLVLGGGATLIFHK